MPFIRRDVWTLPPGDETLNWYGKAIEVLQARPITDVTSWWSLSAMHGIDVSLWEGFKFIAQGAQLPPANLQKALWQQCQHMTWYFLPWHRGYLVAFEKIVRDTIVKLGGPSDWALPYWNYSVSDASRELPRAFESPRLSNGSKNFLYVPQRYGAAQIPQVQTPLVLDQRVVAIARTMSERFFEGTSGGSAGFGGVKTPFWHGDKSGSTFGVLEAQPHGPIHVWVGGGFKGNGLSTNPLEWGLMTNPDTAALDPIFWLHHANIDRAWKAWLRQNPRPSDPPDTFKNPNDSDWLDGPRDQDFAMPKPDGTLYKFVPRDVLDTTAPTLNYVYDDEVIRATPVDRLALRFETLGASRTLADQLARGVTMAPLKPAELLGANIEAVVLSDDVVETLVRLDNRPRQKLFSTLELAKGLTVPAKEPDRVYLNLENIKSPSDAALFYVYVNLPEGADPANSLDHFAGTVSMFGVSKASARQGPNAGNGVSASFDITPIIDKLHVQSVLGDQLSIKLVSAVPGTKSVKISIGRISIYRQGQ